MNVRDAAEPASAADPAGREPHVVASGAVSTGAVSTGAAAPRRGSPRDHLTSPRHTRAGLTRVDIAVVAGLGCLTAAVCVALASKIVRPFWYDEVWRPHFAGEPVATFWSELAHADVPSALGWILLTRSIGDVVGWHAWALRMPVVVSLPLLAMTGYLLARRFTGPGAAGTITATVAGATLGVAGTVVDTATQFKPYSIEALVTVAVVALWTWPSASPARPGEQVAGAPEPSGRPLLRRTVAGALCLFSVPAVFVLVPLAVADVVAPDGRSRLAAAARAAPGATLAGLHALLFVRHQSGQRADHFWDTNFLAGRGLVDGLRFVGSQLLAIASGAPPGIDLPDPNLVHPVTDTTWAAHWLFAPAVVVAFAVGARTVARRRDGWYLLAALVGSEVVQLAASAGRYWPFGAVRTNLFAVPLIVVVVAAGAAALVRTLARTLTGTLTGNVALARNVALPRNVTLPRQVRGSAVASGRAVDPPRPRLGARVVAATGALAVVGTVAAVAAASTTALGPLWRDRDRIRPIELLGDATAATRRLYQPGDLVVVGGRLADAGWSYAMELSEDSTYRPTPAGIATGPAPRLPRDDTTVFVATVGDGSATSAVTDRLPQPIRVILFVLDYDRSGTAGELDRMRAAGWCQTRQWSFESTGTLSTLERCDVSRPAPPAGSGPSAGAAAVSSSPAPAAG